MKTRKSHQCSGAGINTITATGLVSWFAACSIVSSVTATWSGDWYRAANQIPFISSPPTYPRHGPLQSSSQEHAFSLRHIFHHGTHDYPNVHARMDIELHKEIRLAGEFDGPLSEKHRLRAKSRTEPIERLSDRSVSRMQDFYYRARTSGYAATLDASAWTIDEVLGPNITDQETVVTLAKMTNDAYTKVPKEGDWMDVDDRSPYNHSQSFGWEDNGLRGHIWADDNNSTIIIALKGTSPAVFDGAETTTSDKINDNLFFGCCCGQGGQFLWHAACDCQTSAYTCNQTCLVKALKEENRYYKASIELYGNVTQIYPDSNVWLVGHSLGGSTSALLGLTFGLPATTFEAPGEALAAARLGLPSPPGAHASSPQSREYTGAYHFGHTADPIFMGTCNAATSACTLGGYSMQTTCHTGHVCQYDTVQDKGWRPGVGYHKIVSVIHDVLEVYDQPASCFRDTECVDCFNWKYFESNSSQTTTSSSSSSTKRSMTRTATCQTPGWWGCLDESTVSASATTSSTQTLPTTSCLKYGWFGGCLETTTITSPSATTTAAAILTTSCIDHALLGLGRCVASTTMSVFPTSCVKHGWFGNCKSTMTLTAHATPAGIAIAPTITTTRPFPIASGTKGL